jgi:hypothetical protein
MNHVFANVFLENFWLVLIWFGILNNWAAFTIRMPYIVV